MGSFIHSRLFTREKLDAFLYAFSKIPQRVIWKWEGDPTVVKSKNILTGAWMPQKDILGAYTRCRAGFIYGQTSKGPAAKKGPKKRSISLTGFRSTIKMF